MTQVGQRPSWPELAGLTTEPGQKPNPGHTHWLGLAWLFWPGFSGFLASGQAMPITSYTNFLKFTEKIVTAYQRSYMMESLDSSVKSVADVRWSV